MGPRLVSRGKANGIGSRKILVRASMGPRLVSRGKHALASFQTNHVQLQWGRDLLVAERIGSDDKTIANRIASMGPRLVSRGKD